LLRLVQSFGYTLLVKSDSGRLENFEDNIPESERRSSDFGSSSALSSKDATWSDKQEQEEKDVTWSDKDTKRRSFPRLPTAWI